jgi:hypothetical protein
VQFCWKETGIFIMGKFLLGKEVCEWREVTLIIFKYLQGFHIQKGEMLRITLREQNSYQFSLFRMFKELYNGMDCLLMK